MTLPPRLLVYTLPALALVAVFAGDARAQGSRAVTVELMLPDDNGNFIVTTEQTRIEDYFNLARCECAQADETAPESIFKTKLTLDDTTAESQQAQLQVGNSCSADDPTVRVCEQITTIEDIQNLRGGREYDIPVNRLMFPNAECQELVVERNVWVLYDDGADNIYDDEYTLADVVSVDAQPPPLPDNVKLYSAEGAVELSWDLPETRPGDIAYFHVLCVKTDETSPVFDDGAAQAKYDTTQALCGIDPATDLGLPGAFADLDRSFICATTTGTDTNVRVEGLENQQSYEFVLVTADDARNANAMYVGAAEPAPAVDFWEDYKNRGGGADGGVCLVNSTYGDGSGPTQALRDFRDNTLARFALGQAFIAAYYDFVAPLGAYVDGSPVLRAVAAVVLTPLAGLAAFWEYTGAGVKCLVLLLLVALFRPARRRGPGLPPRFCRPGPFAKTVAMGALATLLAIWLAPAPAAAQALNDPYWSDFQPVEDKEPVDRSSWNIGIKVGPYMPAIDSEFNLAAGEMGPYEQMYGDSGIMTMFELDRYFLWPFGQFGATASLGWMSKSGNAYKTVACTDPAAPECMNGFMVEVDADGNPVSSPGNSTKFRLLPAFLGAVYRFTYLDDRFSVPVVPYARAGLSYYLWWFTQPNGSFAEAPTEACPDPGDPVMDCEGDRALGGSLGWQGSLGIAIRAERVDRQAALSLANEYGIEHVGLYAELSYASVDGFGSASRLAVGDFTWFGGLNFEF